MVPFVAIMVSMALSPGGGDIFLIGGIVIVGLVALIIAGFVLTGKQDERLVRLDRFASVNGISFLLNQKDPAYNGMIFDEGHSRRIKEGFRLGDGVEIGNYEYTTGSGKNQQQHTFGYVSVPIDRRLPHMVLDARHNNFLGMSNLPDAFSGDQSLKLEGDFNEHFNLFAPKAYERDALYVFTPDVMASLIDNGKQFDMEVVDDRLYLYKTTYFDLTSQTQLEQVLTIVSKVGSEVRKQSTNYSDERVSDRSQNRVAPTGQRLKQGTNYMLIIFIALFVIAQFSDFLGSEVSIVLFIAVFALLIGRAVYSFVKPWRQ